MASRINPPRKDRFLSSDNAVPGPNNYLVNNSNFRIQNQFSKEKRVNFTEKKKDRTPGPGAYR